MEFLFQFVLIFVHRRKNTEDGCFKNVFLKTHVLLVKRIFSLQLCVDISRGHSTPSIYITAIVLPLNINMTMQTDSLDAKFPHYSDNADFISGVHPSFTHSTYVKLYLAWCIL